MEKASKFTKVRLIGVVALATSVLMGCGGGGTTGSTDNQQSNNNDQADTQPSTLIASFDEASPAVLDAFEGTSYAVYTDTSGNKAGQLTKPTTAQPWGGATFLTCPSGTEGFTPAIPFTAEHTSLSVMVKAPRAGVVFTMKLEGIGAGAGAGVFASATGTSTEWEKLTFDFSNKIAGADFDATKTYNKVSIFPNFLEGGTNAAEESDSVYLFDDLKLEGVTATLGDCPALQAPSSAAVDPTSTPVVSVFSDAAGYTPPDGIDWGGYRTSWSGATLAFESISGNNVIKYSNLGFVGIEPSVTIDVSTANWVNFDVWTPDVATIRLKLVDYGADGIWDQNTNVEHEVSQAITTTGQWVTVRMPMSDFTGLTTSANIGQLIFSNPAETGGTVFIDNFYFSSN